MDHWCLKIIDPETTAQPMVTAELGAAISPNGCISNDEELRRELSEHGCPPTREPSVVLDGSVIAYRAAEAVADGVIPGFIAAGDHAPMESSATSPQHSIVTGAPV